MTHRLNRMLVAFAAIAFGVAMAGSIASAQTCIVVNGVKIYVLPNTYVASGSSGNATFSSNTAIPPAPALLNESLTPQNVLVNVSDVTLGAITTTLDPSRPATPSTIVSNGVVRYPATGTINFYANATIASQPGNNYQSQTELVFSNNSLTQVLPFNAAFTLVNDVTFLDPVTGNSFTLQGGTTNVTLN